MTPPDSGVDADWMLLHGSAAAALRAGDVERAIDLYNGFLKRWPAYAEAYYKRGVAHNRLDRFELALADYDRAIALNPEHGNAFCNRGFVLEKLHRLEEAMHSYDRASAINPDDFLVPYNRASILKQLGRFSDALLSYERAIGLKSDFAEAFVNRGNLLQEMGCHVEAVASFDKAIEIMPVFAAAFQGRGTSLYHLKQFEAAIVAFDHALRLNPEQKFVLGFRRHAQMVICEWDGFARDVSSIEQGLKRREAVCPPHSALALFDAAPLHRLSAETWMANECPPNDCLGAISSRPSDGKIRVGYFSADFREHAVSLLSAELFEVHDRERFEITAFAFGPISNDAVRARLERAFDRFLDVRLQSDIEVASIARRLGIDIAVDLGGYTEHCRSNIFALRAAPIQVNYLGYPGTMGAPFMDYLLADRTVVPESHQCYYREKIVYLPNSFLPSDSTRQITVKDFTRKELGLPESGFVFCCFNNSYKIVPDTFDCWMFILRQVENSVMWLAKGDPAMVRNLTREAARRGVQANRLIFANRMESLPDHLARLRSADLFLDTLPYNAHTTASDALWAGLPLITRCGHAFPGRVAASLLTAIGLPELITSTTEEYLALAVQLARKPHMLGDIRERLVRNRSSTPLFDTRLFVTHLEAAYEIVLARHRSGLPPEHMYVSS